jgi:hypothetical protein
LNQRERRDRLLGADAAGTDSLASSGRLPKHQLKEKCFKCFLNFKQSFEKKPLKAFQVKLQTKR